MGERSSADRIDRVANGLLWVTIVLAPVAGGSSDPRVLPLLTTLVGLATLAGILSAHRAHRRLSVPLPAAWLVLLAGFCLLQVLPIPALLLSQRAKDIHDLVGATGPQPTSYEVGCTLIEAAKLLLYAQVVLLAHSQTRSAGGFRPTGHAVVSAGVAVILVGLFHRALGLERLFGFLPTMRPANTLFTSFVNPNHSAGFLAMVALSALGLAVGAREPRRLGLYLLAAAASAMMSVIAMSKGGLLALAGGLVLFVWLLPRMRAEHREAWLTRRIRLGVGLAVGVVVAVLAAFDRLLSEVGSAEILDRGIAGKLRGLVDVWPMISDHPWLGIGRGAFISVHPGYKSSEAQYLYVYPENFFVQFVSEWGAPIGVLTAIALVICVAARLQRVNHVARLGAIAGVGAMLAQNLVDFSLELPGAAVPAAAIIGATGGHWLRDHRSMAARRALISGLAVALAIAAPVLAWAGLAYGTPRSTIEHLDEVVRARRTGGSDHVVDWASLEHQAERHPASSQIALRLAYLAELGGKNDVPRAFRYANRALYLAPSYADSHLVTGRLLVLVGHRAQGFVAMREGWALSAPDRRARFIEEIVRWAGTADEVLLAVPRRDAPLDIPDEIELARLARQLMRVDRVAWVEPVLAAIHDFGLLSDDALTQVAQLGLSADAVGAAERALETLRSRGAPHGRSAELYVKVVELTRGASAAIELLDELLQRPEETTEELVRSRLRLALRDRDLSRGRQLLETLERMSSADHQGQADLEHDRALLAIAEGRSAKAARALGRAVQLDPGNLRYRIERARVLLELRRYDEAQVELKFVLGVQPQHRAAQSLMLTVQRQLAQGG